MTPARCLAKVMAESPRSRYFAFVHSGAFSSGCIVCRADWAVHNAWTDANVDLYDRQPAAVSGRSIRPCVWCNAAADPTSRFVLFAHCSKNLQSLAVTTSSTKMRSMWTVVASHARLVAMSLQMVCHSMRRLCSSCHAMPCHDLPWYAAPSCYATEIVLIKENNQGRQQTTVDNIIPVRASAVWLSATPGPKADDGWFRATEFSFQGESGESIPVTSATTSDYYSGWRSSVDAPELFDGSRRWGDGTAVHFKKWVRLTFPCAKGLCSCMLPAPYFHDRCWEVLSQAAFAACWCSCTAPV